MFVILKLYFSGGIYIDERIPFSFIDEKAWKYTLTGFEIIFNEYKYKNEKGIYVPYYKKFMKVRFPYSPKVKFMIEQLIKGKDPLE